MPVLSSIQVIRHGFRTFRLEAHDHYSEDSAFVSSYRVEVQRRDGEDGPDLWEVSLHYQFGAKEGEQTGPYDGEIVVEGLFWIRPTFPEEKKESLARMNGGAVLLGAIREAVLNHTIRSMNGPLELPLVDARSFLPESERQIPLIPSRQADSDE